MDKNINKDIIGETIKQRKKMPKELKDKLSNSIFANVVIFIIMIIITLVINIMFNRYSLAKFEIYIKFVQIASCLISIGIFEFAYKKDSFFKSVYGIEFVIFSIAVLYVPYMYISKNIIIFLEIVLKIFAIYYIIKSIFVIIYNKNKFSKENISDIKELVKEEPKKGYIDEESTKTIQKKK